jgi:hypothetical protein
LKVLDLFVGAAQRYWIAEPGPYPPPLERLYGESLVFANYLALCLRNK